MLTGSFRFGSARLLASRFLGGFRTSTAYDEGLGTMQKEPATCRQARSEIHSTLELEPERHSRDTGCALLAWQLRLVLLSMYLALRSFGMLLALLAGNDKAAFSTTLGSSTVTPSSTSQPQALLYYSPL